MELVHATGMQAGYTMGMQPDGREFLVVAVKGTFSIPEDGGPPQLAAEQGPLIKADMFTGQPGLSAPLHESDYPPYKPHCDVLLNGSAYAPGGRPATRVTVSLHVGSVSKSFNVIGDRIWKKSLLSFKPGDPKPFRVMPISYNRAFGGVDVDPKDPERRSAYLTNPVGVGFHEYLNSNSVVGKALPNTEEVDNPVTKPSDKYRPMSFGPVGRAWQPRITFAGTYDQNWLDNIFPFLPPDFNQAYFQAAPPDQQMSYPGGGERVALINLTPEGRTVFHLPHIKLLVWFFLKNGEEKEAQAVMDTVMIEPDARRFMVVWRTSFPLRRNMFEIAQVIVGEKPEDRHQKNKSPESIYPLMPAPPEENTGETESEEE